jgi:hypothetical protein
MPRCDSFFRGQMHTDPALNWAYFKLNLVPQVHLTSTDSAQIQNRLSFFFLSFSFISTSKNHFPIQFLFQFSHVALSNPAMASEPEGITALFSMYNDDDDEEEENELSDQPTRPPSYRKSSPRSPLQPDEPYHKTLVSPRAPTPSQFRSPLSPRVPSPGVSPLPKFTNQSRGRKGALGIVDYGHDEMAVSPEHGVSAFIF